MEKTAEETCSGKNISGLVRYTGYLSEYVKNAVRYINMEFAGELQGGIINLENTSKYIDI